jgi:hypothetical protein
VVVTRGEVDEVFDEDVFGVQGVDNAALSKDSFADA